MNPAAPVTRTLLPTFNSFAADQGQAFALRIFELGRRSSCRMPGEMPRASEPLAMRGFVMTALLAANQRTHDNMLSLCCEFFKPARGRWFQRFG
jgi:hypothetical protein